MTKITELSERLSQIGIKQSDLAALLGVTEETVSRWAKGRTDIPKYAITALDLLVLIKAPLRGAQEMVRKARSMETGKGLKP